MTVRKVAHPSIDQRRTIGRQARDRTSPASHSKWRPAADRPDPVALLEEQNVTREPDLVPVRHGRRLVSPFTFYRGAAKIMAADLAGTPVAGLDAQLCWDAHLSNFGAFASPERRLLFDLNDFDETLPGPFEFDVKRMAASFTVAARNNGLSKAETYAVTRASVTSYREAMAEFAQMRTMDIWYAHLDEDQLMTAAGLASPSCGGKRQRRRRRRKATSEPGGRRQRRRIKSRRSGTCRRTGTRSAPRGGRRRHWTRRVPGTACRPCLNSASWPMASTGSRPSRRSSYPPGTWAPPTAYPPTRSCR
jgi:Uncharacterized protein conserved in bacteria (DUF2252)